MTTLTERIRNGSGEDRELSRGESLAIKAIRERNRALVAYPYISNQAAFALLAAKEKET